MSNKQAATSYGKYRKYSYLTAMVVCSVSVLSGCRIPGLRQAEPGPVMPQFYSCNNRALFWSNESAGSDNKPIDSKGTPDNTPDEAGDRVQLAVTSDSVATRSKNILSRIKLASFSEPARLFGFGEDDDSAQKAGDSSDEPVNENRAVSEYDRKAQADDTTAESGESSGSLSLPLPAPPTMDMEAGVSESSSQIPLSAFFDDPLLVVLINQALSGNQELRILAEEINIANNETYARSGEYLPFVTLGGGAGLEKPSRFSRAGAVEEQLEVAPGRGFPEPLPDFLVATNVSWELDIWKKLRNAQSAAAMRYLGTQEGRNYIVTRMVAEVAENYYELLALDNRLMTLQQTIEIQQQSLKVAQAKKEAGRGTELAVQRFLGEVRKNQSELRIIQQEIVEAENRINFLVGRYPQPVERTPVEYIDLNLATLSAGLPSQLLLNRADIRKAERQVEAAGLDVKVARARFYPSLGLQAGVGLNAYNMRYLLSTPESLIYNAALDLVGPLINRRAIEADYCSANAAQLQSIYNYQRTVLTAHIEVVNHMTKVENYRQSIEVKKQQLEALEASVNAANQLFQNARAEYVEVLLAQREMMEARMLLIETKQQQLGAIVNAYQALGGGGF